MAKSPVKNTKTTATAPAAKAKNSVRPVSAKIRNAVARDRRSNPPMADVIARTNARDAALSPKGKGGQKKNAEVNQAAEDLFNTWANRGVTFAQAKHAVVSGKVSDRQVIWAQLPAIKDVA